MRLRPLLILIVLALTLTASACGEQTSKESGKESVARATGKSGSAKKTAAKTANGDPDPQKIFARKEPKITVPSAPAPATLVKKDLIAGTGQAVHAGQQIAVNYRGVAYSTGKTFDSSYPKGQPFPFVLGQGQVIPGWDQGLEGMKVGGRRELVIPAKLAYGAQGQPPTIKPNEPLIFVIDLIAVAK